MAILTEDRTRLTVFAMSILLLAVFLPAIPVGVADDHKLSGNYFGKHSDSKSGGLLDGFLQRGHDEGNEATGQIVAWGFAAANLTVALSLLIRGVKRFAPLGPEAQNSLSRFNRAQKSVLMKLHYAINPLILLVAVIHWTLSRCKSTALPEWGVLTMAAVVVLGIILKFKLCPKGFLKNVYKLHTQPVILMVLVSLLVVGHFAME